MSQNIKKYLVTNLSKLNYKSGSRLIFVDEYLFNLYKSNDLNKYQCSFANTLNYLENGTYTDSNILKKKLKIYRNELSQRLNYTHKKNYSSEYWGVLIDYVLIKIIDSIQKETKLLRNVKKIYKHLWVTDYNHCKWLFNTYDLNYYIENDQNYQKMIRCIISKEIGINVIKNNNKTILKKYISNEKISTNLISSFVNFIFRLSVYLFKPIIILDGYFGKKNSIKIFLRSFGKIFFIPANRFFNEKKFFFKINLKLRNKIKIKEKDFLDKIFNLVVGRLFPATCLEGFNFMRKKNLFFSKKISKIGTGINMLFNDQFKFLVAEILQNKGKLISFQHGGLFGKLKFSPQEIIEKKYSIKRYQWDNPKGLGQHFLSKLKKMSLEELKKNQLILIYPTVFLYQNGLDNLQKNNHPYLEQSYDFFKNLNEPNKKNVLTKLFPSQGNEKIKKIWMEKFNNKINFAEINSKITKFYESKLVVLNDVSTPLYELMYIGVPFIIITNSKFNNFQKKFAKDLNKLEKLNILFRCPIKAAKFVNNKNDKNDKIVDWWKSVSKKKNFINFKKTLFIEKENYISSITRDLIKI